MVLWRRAGLLTGVLVVLAGPAWAQVAPQDQLPKDDIFRRKNPDDMTSKALVLDVHPEWPILVVGTVEYRQINLGRPVYAVVARNRSVDPVKSYTLAAVIVGTDGTTKAVQRLAKVKNLQGLQERKQDVQIRAAIPSISDRIIFLVAEIEQEDGERWGLDDEALRNLVKKELTAQ
jgi:hypothetical protein